MANRFEQVDEVVADAITIVLSQQTDGQWAKVYCPRTAHASLAVGPDQRAGPAQGRALRGAVKLANQLKLAIVVADPDGVWKNGMGRTLPPAR